MRLIKFIIDRVVELLKVALHAGTDVAASAVLCVLVDDRLHSLRVLGMVSRRPVTCLTADVEFGKCAFLVIGASSMAVTALIEPIKPFECPFFVLADRKMLPRAIILKLARDDISFFIPEGIALFFVPATDDVGPVVLVGFGSVLHGKIRLDIL